MSKITAAVIPLASKVAMRNGRTNPVFIKVMPIINVAFVFFSIFNIPANRNPNIISIKKTAIAINGIKKKLSDNSDSEILLRINAGNEMNITNFKKISADLSPNRRNFFEKKPSINMRNIGNNFKYIDINHLFLIRNI